MDSIFLKQFTQTISLNKNSIKSFLKIIILFVATGVFSACSLVNNIVAKGASSYLEGGALVFQSEQDIILAKDAIPANFKLLEVLLQKAPNNLNLLTLASQYAGFYSYGFIEPEIEVLELDYENTLSNSSNSNTDVLEKNIAITKLRASNLYLRGRDYGLKAMSIHYPKVFKALNESPEALKNSLKTLGKKDLPLIFWTAFSWGTYININIDKPEALLDSDKVSIMMERAIEIDESYYYAGAHLFFGALQARIPVSNEEMLRSSKNHFEKAIALGGQQFLMSQVFFARYYAVRVQDRALFAKTLNAVLETDISKWKYERLANEMAQKRAQLYLKNINEYFLNPEL